MATMIGLVALLPFSVVFAHRALAPMILIMGFAVGSRGEPWRIGIPYFLLKPDLKDPVVLGGYAMLAFCAWLGLTAIWSPLGEKWELSIGVFLPVLAGGALVWEILRRVASEATILANVFAVVIVLSALLLLIEGLTGAPLRAIFPPEDLSPQRYKDFVALGRGVSVIAPAVFPAAAIIYRITDNKFAPVVVIMLAIAAAMIFSIEANFAALVVGGLASLFALLYPKRIVLIMTWLIVMVLVAAPFIAVALPVEWLMETFGESLSLSWLQRLYVWREAGAVALDGLPFGHGIDYARAWSEEGGMILIPNAPIPLPEMPTHPHNIFLQIWLELGLPGVVAFGLFIISGGRALAAVEWVRPVVACVIGAIAVTLISALVEASLWQVWRISAVVLAAMGASLSYSVYQIGDRAAVDARRGIN